MSDILEKVLKENRVTIAVAGSNADVIWAVSELIRNALFDMGLSPSVERQPVLTERMAHPGLVLDDNMPVNAKVIELPASPKLEQG